MKTLKEHFDNLTEAGKVQMINEAAKSLVSLQKRKDKALESELSTPIHSSRAKRTTVYANSHKITQSYLKQVEYLKEIVKLL